MLARFAISAAGGAINVDTGQGCNPALPVAAGVPIDLYESIQGRFFLGYADGLAFGKGTNAWAGLFNPPDSGVNLFVWAFGVTNVARTAYRIQIWFNAIFPGESRPSDFVSPANTAVTPLPAPRVELRYAARIDGIPAGGVKAFVRRGEPGTTILSIEDGKFICPPGGSFAVLLSNPETPELEAAGQISFQWWEEEF